MIRAAERWRELSVADLERRPLDTMKAGLDAAY